MSTATPLPPPPPPPGAPDDDDTVGATSGPLPGQLTRGWRLATVFVWGATFAAQAGVWKASRELGLSTWWRGPISDPQPFLMTLIPFIGPAAMAVAALYGVRRLPWYGLAASAVTAAVGLGDLGRVVRIGLVELAMAAATALFSVASLAGRYRRSP